MKRHRAIPGLGLVACLLLACATESAPPILTAAGISYELPLVAEELRVDDRSVYFRNEALDLRVVGRELILNSIPYGTLRRGDHVRLTPQGRLYVNGIERRAASR